MAADLIIALASDLLPAALFAPTPKAARRVLEFFTAQVNNDHTRKAYLNATRRFAAWCEDHGLHELAAVQPFHVAAFVKELEGQFTPPTVKQHLAALRMLFDWLVTGHVMETNPAHWGRPNSRVTSRQIGQSIGRRVSMSRSKRPYGLTWSQISGVSAPRSRVVSLSAQ
jgi:site-specific recombinase XerC